MARRKLTEKQKRFTALGNYKHITVKVLPRYTKNRGETYMGSKDENIYFASHDDPLGRKHVLEKYQTANAIAVLFMRSIDEADRSRVIKKMRLVAKGLDVEYPEKNNPDGGYCHVVEDVIRVFNQTQEGDMSTKTTVWLFELRGIEFHFYNEPLKNSVYVTLETRNIWIKVKAFPRFWLPKERKHMEEWMRKERRWFFT